MYTPPYKVVKRYRGKYEVLDAKGLSMVKYYVSKHEANHVRIEHELQDKALASPKLLIAAEALTTLKGEDLKDWLYQTLIRLDIQELRLIINRPSQLKKVYEDWISRMKKRLTDEA